MTRHHDLIETILVWVGVITSFITPFLPLLQFIAVVLAIAVSIKNLFRKKRKSNV
jgi:uncharacterized protein (DUF2062 family)